MEDTYSTIEQVAKQYKVSISTVRAWIRKKAVPVWSIGDVYRLKIKEIDDAFTKHAAVKETIVVHMGTSDVSVTEAIAPEQSPIIDTDKDL